MPSEWFCCFCVLHVFTVSYCDIYMEQPSLSSKTPFYFRWEYSNRKIILLKLLPSSSPMLHLGMTRLQTSRTVHSLKMQSPYYIIGMNNLCGRPPQYAPASCELTFDLLTLMSESCVTWATSVPILIFLGLSVLDLGPMYTTDSRQTRIIA